MDFIIDQVKKYEPEKLNDFKRMYDLSKEITRLECLLAAGTVHKQMMNNLILKEIDLEKELSNLVKENLLQPLKTGIGLKDYHEKFMNIINLTKKKEIREKYNFNTCEWCNGLIPAENGNDCPDEECVSNDLLWE